MHPSSIHWIPSLIYYGSKVRSKFDLVLDWNNKIIEINICSIGIIFIGFFYIHSQLHDMLIFSQILLITGWSRVDWKPLCGLWRCIIISFNVRVFTILNDFFLAIMINWWSYLLLTQRNSSSGYYSNFFCWKKTSFSSVIDW